MSNTLWCIIPNKLVVTPVASLKHFGDQLSDKSKFLVRALCAFIFFFKDDYLH